MTSDNPDPIRPVRLLLVDDHPLVRDGLRLRLESSPRIKVVGEAEGGAPAVALLEALDQPGAAGLPDMLLTDLSMRGMGGLDLVALVHERWPQTAVLVLSMYDNPEWVIQALRAGARGYVTKDEPAAQIMNAIDEVMKGRTYLSAAIATKLSQASASGVLLSPREREILQHISEGRTNKDIALTLSLSVRTVETHRQNLKRKLGIEGQSKLVKFAVENRGV